MASGAASATLRVPLTAEEKTASKATVCVTGAGGYVASAVVQRLLATGHTVHAAIRSQSKASHLLSLPGADLHLVIFEGCDLTKEGSFDAAINGCDYVMHMASPFALGLTGKRVKELLLDPAVEGTKNVLGSVNRTPSVKRVVLTSSIAAVLSYPEKGKVYCEEDWNNQASEHRFAYELSKTLAERAAWEVYKMQDRWSMVVLNPGLVLGPPLAPLECESVHIMRRIMRGDLVIGYPEYLLRAVDVRDAAKAHCLAMVKSEVKGRIIVAPHDMSFGRASRILAAGPLGKRLLSRLRLPTRPLNKWILWALADIVSLERYRLVTTCGVPLRVDCSKCDKDLGITTWVPEADTYNEMAVTMAAFGLCRWMSPTAWGAPAQVKPGKPGAIAPAPSDSPTSPTSSAAARDSESLVAA